MSGRSTVIQSIGFADHTVMIDFARDDDVRAVSARPVILSRTLILPRDHPEYEEQLESLHDIAVALVAEAEGDWDEAGAWAGQVDEGAILQRYIGADIGQEQDQEQDEDDEEDDDDDEGMGQ